MPLFFNGRLYTSPAVMSRVDDSAMFNANPAVGNILALLGSADAGAPKTELRFGSPNEAASVLRGGPLLDAVVRAFGGTVETPAPSTVVAIRTQPATQSSLQLLNDSDTPVINLKSEEYGLSANRVQVQITSGTTRGKRIRTRLDQLEIDEDNIGRDVLEVQYAGAAASATVTVTTTGVVLAAPSGSALPEISFADAPTVADLVQRISAVPDWVASVLDNADEHPTADALDFVAAADAKTAPLALTANLAAIVAWFNSSAETLVSAEKVAGAGTMPANVSPGAYLSGAVTGSVTTQDWSDAFLALQQIDAQWVVPVSGDAAIHAMTAAHVKFCSDILRRERRSICGTPLATSDEQAKLAARALNSDRVGLVHLGVYDYDTAGKLTLYSPYIAAAIIGGGFSGVNPGTAMTNKALAVSGLERRLRNPTDTDELLKAGVIPLEDTPQGYKVVQSISTWLVNNNYNKRELSVGAAIDYVARSLREALQPVVGKGNGPARIVEGKARASATLRELARPEPQGIGVIVGDENNPAWRNLTIVAEGDVLRAQVEVSPVIPVNYVPITIFAVPYSSAAAA